MKLISIALSAAVLACGSSSSTVSDAGDNDAGTSDAGSVVPKGARVFGIDFADVAQSGSYAANTSKAKGLGASATSLSLQWNQIEAASGSPGSATSGAFVDPGGALADSQAFYPANGLSLSLTIRSIDTVAVPVPADLSGVAFDNAALIARYNAMLDFVFARIPGVTLVSLQIGNEIDVSSISTATFWAQYATFVSQVAAHAHGVRAGLKVGFTVTYSAASGSLAAQIGDAAQAADLIGITYYPLNTDYTVKAPTVVSADFANLVSAFSAKPIYLQEVGYPSGSANSSSDAQQLQFFQAVFAAWDAHAAQIPYLSIVRLYDLSAAAAQSEATGYGLGGNGAFVSYLQTLGIAAYTGSDKAAVAGLAQLTASRGF